MITNNISYKEVEIIGEEEVESKIQKVIVEPRLSLKQFSRYVIATEKGKNKILLGSKYPGDYIPKFYEKARKLICELFAGNFEDIDLYFEEFKRQSKLLREEAKGYEENRDGFKNRAYSATGLDKICLMSEQLKPILEKYILDSNLRKRRDAILEEEVKIGAVADMLVSENGGATQVGFIKFNFTTQVLSKDEAETMLFILNKFFEKKGIYLNPKSCFLIDVYAFKVFTLSKSPAIEAKIKLALREIGNKWDKL